MNLNKLFTSPEVRKFMFYALLILFAAIVFHIIPVKIVISNYTAGRPVW